MIYVDTTFKIESISNQERPDLVLVKPAQYESIIRLNVRKLGGSREDIIYQFIKNNSDKDFICASVLRDDSYLNFKNINFNKIVMANDGNKVSLGWYWVKHWGYAQLRECLIKYSPEARKINFDYPVPSSGEDNQVSFRDMLLRTSYGNSYKAKAIWLMVADPEKRPALILYSIINSVKFYKIDLSYAQFKESEGCYGGLNIAWLLAEYKHCDVLLNYYLMNPLDFIKLDFNICPSRSQGDTGKTLAWILARDPDGRKILNSIKVNYPDVFTKIDQSAFPISGYEKKSVGELLSNSSMFAVNHENHTKGLQHEKQIFKPNNHSL